MLDKIASLLRIRRDETRLVLLVGLLFLCMNAGQGLGDNAASALFFLRYGVDRLPYMYVLLGATTIVLTLAYSAGLGRFPRSRYFQALVLGTLGLLLVERLVLLRPFPLLYPAIWLTVNWIGMIHGTYVWNLAGDVVDARQAKRLFPLFTSAGILGSVLGNSITGPVAHWLGTDELLVLFAALLAGGWLLTRAIAARYFRPAKAGGKPESLWSQLRSGYDFVRGSALMRLVAYASVLFSILFFAIAFPFNKVVTASFPDEASVAGYLGLFTGIATAVTFLVSLLLANRLYARLGIVNSVLLLPVTYLLGFIVFASQYNLAGAVVARFAQMVMLQAVAATAWNALFNVVPSQKRAQVMAFQNGPPTQLGVAISGVLLILGDKVLSSTQILLMGIVVALACGFLVWKMRRAYGDALLDALRAGRLEVFTGNGGFSGLHGDAGAVRVLSWALTDPRPATRRLAAQILGRVGNPSVVAPLTVALSDPEPTVRAEVLRALAALDIPPGAELRSNAERLLRDPALEVRMPAILLLARLGETEAARASLRAALAERDVTTRVAALEAFGQAAAYLDGSADAAPVIRLLADTVSAVRVAACHALAPLRDDVSARALVTRLHDAHPEVRSAAAQALRGRSPQATDAILGVLDSEYEAARDAALDALQPGSLPASERLRRFAQGEIERLRRLRSDAASLPASGRAVRLLCEALRRDVRQGESRLVKIVGLIGNARAMELVQKSLHGSDGEERAAALEALETLGDKALAREIITLLEEEPRAQAADAALAGILSGGTRWERALAIRSAQELGLRELDPQLAELSRAPDPLIAESAAEALVRMEAARTMNTLQTISTLERVLLLREVPIFSELSPEDLQQVAAIAAEQWFPKDTVIFRQDEPGDRMYVIVDGQVEVVRSAAGTEQVLARRGPGDFVGEMAIIDAAPRLASLVTRSDVRVLAIDGETFKAIIRERPEVSLAMLRILSRRLRERG